MKIYLSLVLICIVSIAKSSHIVGGEFNLEHQTDFNYRLSLSLYYDVQNSNFVVERDEPVILAHIFSKRDNRLVIEGLVLTLRNTSDIQFTNPACTNGPLQTRRLVYDDFIFLDPEIFNEPEGYYVIWERCCRNNIINNIETPGDVGMVFYLEFPPVVQDNQPFVNSSPRYSIPVGDYLCLNEEFTFDFGATDADGDSLNYYFTTPLIGNSTPIAPGGVNPSNLTGGVPPAPAPYDTVVWLNANGVQFGAQNAFPSNQPVVINPETGLIRVTPSNTGLFVFSVVCEEFRNGVKIGESRRDYQLFVLDCNINQDPTIEVENVDSNVSGEVFYQESDTLYFDEANDQLCTNIWVKDPNLNELLTINLLPINFELNQSLLSANRVRVNGENDSTRVALCWPRCFFSSRNDQSDLEPYILDLVVSDDRCPRPAYDTIRLTIISIPIDNHPPSIQIQSTTEANNEPGIIYYQESDTLIFDEAAGELCTTIWLKDPDFDQMLTLDLLGINFEPMPGLVSINQGIVNGPDDSLEISFCWPECLFSSQDEEGNNIPFVLDLIVNDIHCVDSLSDTIRVQIVSIPIVNQPPSVQVEHTEVGEPASFFYQESDTLYFDEANGVLCTNIWLKDPDFDELLRLNLRGVNFQPSLSLISANQGVVNGPADSLQVVLCWPECFFSSQDEGGNLEPFIMDLIVNDVKDDTCTFSMQDTLRLYIISLPFENNPPEIGSNTLANGNPDFDYSIELLVGETFDFDVFARDLLDNDQIDLRAIGRGFDLEEMGMDFEDKTGIGSLNSRFIWETDCETIDVAQQQYIIDFITSDQGDCENDTSSISVELVLTEPFFDDEDFKPDNAFSPNGDQINDVYFIDSYPRENCLYHFKQIRIFTRWGNKVFESFDKDFVWDGGNLPTGVYFYIIDFNSKTYKGSITLFK